MSTPIYGLGAVDRTNLIPNPSFEAGSGEWDGINSDLADDAVSGSKSLRSTAPSSGDSAGYLAVYWYPANEIVLDATTTYTFSFYVKASTPLSLDSYSAYLGLDNLGYVYIDVSEVGTEWQRAAVTFTTGESGDAFYGFALGNDPDTLVDGGTALYLDAVLFEKSDAVGDYFDGSTPDTANLTAGTGYQYDWTGAANDSTSTRRPVVQTGTLEPVVPVRNLSTQDVLYGDRVTSYRWEVLTHDNGVDSLAGVLDGVTDGQITWTQNVAVKGAGKVSVADLNVAKPGLLRIVDLPLASVRLRPVCIIEGLPENPLGTYLVTSASEQWEATGRTWALDLLDRCTVLDQDLVEESYAVAAGTVVLQEVRSILASAGEYISIDESVALATSSGMVWDAGTSKLKIVNDLLGVINYNALWIDGYGNFQTTVRVLPADRDLTYELLGVPRELQDGEQGIYQPSWTRDRDSFSVPNKVIAVQSAGADDEAALVGEWTNEDATSPYSYQARGRWITYVASDVDVPDGTDAEIVAFLNARAQTTLVQMSAVQAQVKVTHLPIPVRVGDVLRFANVSAGVDGRHTITQTQLDLNSLGLMQSQLQEVISL